MRQYGFVFWGMMMATSLFASGTEKAALEVTYIAKLDEKSGKKVWVGEPSAFTAVAGKPLKVHIKNEFKDAVHGFHIKGLTEAMPIPGNSTKTVTVTPKKAGTYAVECHMHPAHVGTQLIVK